MKFTHNGTEHHVDDEIHCKRLINKPGYRILTKDFHCMGDIIPAGTEWNGASTPNVPFLSWIAPKFFKNLVASCGHDFWCSRAKISKDRKIADKKYFLLKKYVELDDSWKCKLSYVGVRVGAYMGIGNSY